MGGWKAGKTAIELWSVVGQGAMADMDPTQVTTRLHRLPQLLLMNVAVGGVAMGGGDGMVDMGGGVDMEGVWGGGGGCCWAGLVDLQEVYCYQKCFEPN